MKRYLLLIISVICLAASAQEQTSKPRPPRMTPEEFRAKQKEFTGDMTEHNFLILLCLFCNGLTSLITR